MNADEVRAAAALLRTNAPSFEATIASEVGKIDKLLTLPMNLLAGDIKVPVFEHPVIDCTVILGRLVEIYREKGFETMAMFPEGVATLYLSW